MTNLLGSEAPPFAGWYNMTGSQRSQSIGSGHPSVPHNDTCTSWFEKKFLQTKSIGALGHNACKVRLSLGMLNRNSCTHSSSKMHACCMVEKIPLYTVLKSNNHFHHSVLRESFERPHPRDTRCLRMRSDTGPYLSSWMRHLLSRFHNFPLRRQSDGTHNECQRLPRRWSYRAVFQTYVHRCIIVTVKYIVIALIFLAATWTLHLQTALVVESFNDVPPRFEGIRLKTFNIHRRNL